MNSWLQAIEILQRGIAALQADTRRETVRQVAERLAATLEMAGTLSLPAVARRLGVHRATAWKWVQRGRLPAVRVGHRYRVPRDIIGAMLRPVDEAAGPAGEWRCPAPECPAAYATAAALAAHLATTHLGEAGI